MSTVNENGVKTETPLERDRAMLARRKALHDLLRGGPENGSPASLARFDATRLLLESTETAT